MSAIGWFGSVVLGLYIIGYTCVELLQLKDDRRKGRRR